jgi:UDP-N-acetylmuramoylalanine--D-glutamate ligase
VTQEQWAGRRICVAGIGVSGASAARALLDRSARVLVVDAAEGDRQRVVAEELRAGGADVRLGAAETHVDAEMVVTSPGWRPTNPLLVAAHDSGVEVIGEPELAWRLQVENQAHAGPVWLGITGTNGKTTTVGMLASILAAAGYRTVAAGNVGLPLVDAVLADPPYDVLAVEMSSFQLHWSSSIEFQSAAVTNIAPDHLDWHGSFDAYAADKAKIWTRAAHVLFNGDDPTCTSLASDYDSAQCFTVAEPGPGCFGVVDAMLVDRTSGSGSVLCARDDLHVPGDHNLANALAAAGLSRQLSVDPRYPVPVASVAAGLSAYRPGPHRNAVVATVDGVAYVDDSKATNAHAAAASLSAYDNVVWIAGGLLKGATVDELVADHRARLRGVVLIGADRARIRDALARHAPDVPVVEVEAADTGAMTAIVSAAGRLATPGDTVLLAPAAASMDMFRDYAERGDAFATAVRRLAEDGG